jgi:hypothetical protein
MLATSLSKSRFIPSSSFIPQSFYQAVYEGLGHALELPGQYFDEVISAQEETLLHGSHGIDERHYYEVRIEPLPYAPIRDSPLEEDYEDIVVAVRV